MPNILEQRYTLSRSKVEEIINDVHQLAIDIGHDEMISILGELRTRLHDPFMFVVVGEVKSGKSSFINALLDTGKDICAVAPSPMTDTIQQIVWGEEELIQQINPYLKKVYQPVDILREIAIVDTPGTNTIIEHHQEITERFVPSSDLIVLVFEAKNPYRQSAWEFFDLIRDEWRKKIIFVLQQKDLLPESDLQVNLEGIRAQARSKGIDEAIVFAVSAKDEQEGRIGISGFASLRHFIRDHITGGKAPYLKLESSLETGQTFASRIKEGVALRKKQNEADRLFRKDIHNTLVHQQKLSVSQVDMLVENLIAGFDSISQEKRDELSGGLSFFSLMKKSIQSIFSKQSSPKMWLQQLAKAIETDLHDRLTSKLQTGVTDLADSIQNMVRIIDLKIRNSETILKNDHEFFSDIAERRSSVMRDLQDTFHQFLSDPANFRDEDLFQYSKDMSPQVATGSGLAIIGIILSAVTNGMVLDITGGVISAIGLLFAGISVGINKRKVLRRFDAEMESGKQKLQATLTEKLYAYIEHLKDKIEGHFSSFDLMTGQEAIQIAKLENNLDRIDIQITEELVSIGKILEKVTPS